MLPAADI